MSDNDPFHEDDELEKFKKWWKENGTGLMLGIGLGLAAVAGWQYWQRTTQAAAEKASAYFEGLQASLREDDKGPALRQAQRLLDEDADSVYAAFSALQLAKLQYQQGEAEAAIAQFRWVLGADVDESIKQIARLRLARVLIEQDQASVEVQKILDQGLQDPVLTGEFQVLKGDLAMARGQIETAKEAYQKALESDVKDEVGLRMKLADLGLSGESS